MMQRWSEEERDAVTTIRNRLRPHFKKVDPNPEVIGDRALIRFYRGHNRCIDTACNKLIKYYDWRQENNVDAIRRNIVHNGINNPRKFPSGNLILSLVPQKICDFNALDKHGGPISVITCDYSPSEVFSSIQVDEYQEFVLYLLEYQQVVLEQLSEKKERMIIEELSSTLEGKSKDTNGVITYGTILQTTVVRDLSGLRLEHIGWQGQKLLKIMIDLAFDNYPELLHKMYIINTPWIFDTFFWGLKQLLSERTLEKISVLGEQYEDAVKEDVDTKSLEEEYGGTYTFDSSDKDYFSFQFDIDDGGLLALPQDTLLQCGI